MTDAPTEILAPLPAGSCRSCSAPLAADQRYCLSCGARVGAPRVDWAATLAGRAGTGSAGAEPAGEGGRAGARWAQLLDRVGGPMGAAAVVLVALAVGFLLGQGSGGGGNGGPATIIQRPPVVNVQGGGTAAPADASADRTSDASGGGSKHRGRAAGGSTAGIPKAAPDDAGGDLDRLRAQPDQQATGGEAPRTDRKPAGGGTDAETIG